MPHKRFRPWRVFLVGFCCWWTALTATSSILLAMVGFAFGHYRSPSTPADWIDFLGGALVGVVISQVWCLPLAAAVSGARVLAVRLLRTRPATGAADCLGCGYDLTGNITGRCPECGRERDVVLAGERVTVDSGWLYRVTLLGTAGFVAWLLWVIWCAV